MADRVPVRIPSPRLAPLQRKPPGTLLIHEIYRSLQGESRFAGLPCVFVRLTTCQLRCGYCDTPHAFHEGTPRPIEEVAEEAIALGDRLVEVTGGEPLLQAEVHPLMTQLCDAGRTVLLETSGSLDIAPVDPRVHIILDLKTPGSGEVEANLWPNLDRIKPGDEIKFVVCDRRDFDWAMDVIRRHDLDRRVEVLLSPAYGAVQPTDLAEWVLESHRPVRLQLQLHKGLWGPNRRGV